MKLKLDEAGHASLDDGRPVYVYEDGKEIPFDAPGTVATISRLNAEAKGHREAKEKAENSLKAYEGIDDADAARAALQTVANLDGGQLIQAGKVEEIKAAAQKAAEERIAQMQTATARQLDESAATNKALTDRLYGEMIGGAFNRSKFIAEKVAVPADMLQATFGHAFKVEDEGIVAYAKDGNKIFSRAKPGELAQFDEALELLIETYPFRDHVLKGTGANGGGGNGGGGNNQGGAKQINRAAFDSLSPDARMEHVRAGGKVVD